MRLSIVIVNYNVRHYLWQCLDSVRRASAGLDVEVWVVDNASTDDSIAYLRQYFPDVHYIENTENVGFSKANNAAIRQATGDFVLLLNPDTFVAEDTLRQCLSFMEAHPRCGAIGIHMLNRDGSFARESRRGLPTPATSLYKVMGLCALFPRHPRFGRYYMGHLPEYEEGQIEVISGAFMMLRRTALDEQGLLDEDYFMYGEDIDMSYRIGKGGWECWYIPQKMLHYKGESTQDTSLRYIHSFYNAMLIFFHKHFARRYRMTAALVRVAVVTMGFMSYLRNHLRRMLNRLYGVVCRPPAETLCFIGTEEAWQQLQPICEQAGLVARHVKDYHDAAKNTTYLTFEVTEKGRPYDTMLTQMEAAHREGWQSSLGTFNTINHTLILPNDIFC